MERSDQGAQAPAHGADAADNFNILSDLVSAPCFRQSSLYSIGGGAAIGGLQLLRNRKSPPVSATQACVCVRARLLRA